MKSSNQTYIMWVLRSKEGNYMPSEGTLVEGIDEANHYTDDPAGPDSPLKIGTLTSVRVSVEIEQRRTTTLL